MIKQKMQVKINNILHNSFIHKTLHSEVTQRVTQPPSPLGYIIALK